MLIPRHISKAFVITPTNCTDEDHRLPLLLQTTCWVKQQIHRDYLYIVVDDESTDSTPEVLERLSKSDPNLKVIRKGEGGSKAAINYGVEQALALDKPDYITVCHSDDLLLPESLDIRVQIPSQSATELIYSDSVVINDTGLLTPRHRSEFFTIHKTPGMHVVEIRVLFFECIKTLYRHRYPPPCDSSRNLNSPRLPTSL
ncbi:MAG: hypothetical protein CMI18_11125 [Opitutaceae bacterium]|nr:hypothetical protein [Opitutaceae bacterium]